MSQSGHVPETPAKPSYLADSLRAAGRLSFHGHDRLVDRLAATFITRDRHGRLRDYLPNRLVSLNELRLVALTHRWVSGRYGRPCPVAPLAVYKFIFDPAVSRPIRLACCEAWDLRGRRGAPPQGLLERPALARVAVALMQSMCDAGANHLSEVLTLPRIYLAFDPRRSPTADLHHPAASWDAAEVRIQGLRAWPVEMFASGEADSTTSTPAPVTRFADVSHFRGRVVRNPAYDILRRHGLLYATSFRGWRATVAGPDGEIIDPHANGTPTERLRSRIERHATGDPCREAALLSDLRAACHAIGLPVSPGPDGLDTLATLIDNPWDCPIVPGSSSVNVIRLTDAASSETLRFSGGGVDLDLNNLGRRARLGEEMPRWFATQFLRRNVRDSRAC